jgi:SpoIID/LytB domain protein
VSTAQIGIRYFNRMTRKHALLLTCACAAILFFSLLPTRGGWGSMGLRAQKEQRDETEIDSALQEAATSALAQHEGAVIVLDPQTGRVRALVNSKLAFTQALMPGSTMKPFTALAALRAGLIDEDSRTACPGRFTGLSFSLPCVHADHLPSFTPSQAIAYSCNYYFASIGQRLGRDRLVDTLRTFGFGQPNGLAGIEEVAGTLRPCETGNRARILVAESNHAGQSDCDAREAVGESDHIQVTPIQLLAAYAALVNGGHLFRASAAGADDFQAVERARLEISEPHRRVIVEGMRGAVRYGTAKTARLDSLPVYVIGKTGTAQPPKGFRPTGWFVGFAGSGSNSVDGEMKPEGIRLAVLVMLARSHGSEAAAFAKPIFQAYANATNNLDRESKEASANNVGDQSTLRDPQGAIKVHLVSDNVTRELSLEDYVLGVLRTEGSVETEPEALKALAIAIRTYAVKNRGRHARDGFDFCSTTHCQRFAANSIRSPAASGSALDQAFPDRRASDSMIAAVKATEGQVLLDDHNQTADAYFGASCGGETANEGRLWGVTPPAYLRGVRDEYCVAGPHATWTDVISRADLLRALQTDGRTDVGQRLNQVVVSKRDETGRAEFITLEGEYRKTVRGWDFKIIVGRVLGWNVLKSSRFEVARAGTNFVFRGRGFGHGLGLCQEGAHVMAQRGISYQRILQKYFPGTSVAPRSGKVSLARPFKAGNTEENDYLVVSAMIDSFQPSLTRGTKWYADGKGQSWKADLMLKALPLPSGDGRGEGLATSPHRFELFSYPSRSEKKKKSSFRYPLLATPLTPALSQRERGRYLALSSEHFRVTYPADVDRRDADQVLNTLEASRADFLHRALAAAISTNLPMLEIRLNESTGDFTARTGQPWWAAAATKGNRIELQPVGLLKRRGVLTTTLRHELAHAVIDAVSRKRAPRWLEEGFALYLAGEGRTISRYLSRSAHSTEELEKRLGRPGSQEDMRALYAEAYRTVFDLISTVGEADVWKKLAAG